MEYLSLQDLSEKSPETLPFSRWQGKSSFSLKMNISMQNLAFSLPHPQKMLVFCDLYGLEGFSVQLHGPDSIAVAVSH